jgi:hypothetical protein
MGRSSARRPPKSSPSLVCVDLAGISFVLGVTAETVLTWLCRAAHQAEVINHHLLRHLQVTQGQLDEMWNLIARKHARGP